MFGYDALGHMTSMTRYQDATNQTGAVTTTWHYDSLGWMTKLEEPGVAAQTRTFDSWGEITQVQWCDDLSQAPCPTQDRRSIMRFDAIGRITHREDQTNNSGLPVPGTAMDYTYDSGVDNSTPPVTATNTTGRLATAIWPTGKVSLSYDAFGRVNATVFTDTSVSPNKVYVEKHESHDDGSEKTLHLLLPDNSFKDEKVDYAYDSAGRTISAIYNDGATPPTTQSLFSAFGSSAIYDVFGRITQAQYGLSRFNASFAAAGRRLLTEVRVTSADLQASRSITFPTLNNLRAFDPVGRERQRQELGWFDVPPGHQLRSYDGLGRLSATQYLQDPLGTPQADRSFTYDPLDNMLTQTDASSGNPGGVSLTYQTLAFDRICSIAYGANTPPAACNVSYDGAGNIISQPARSDTRTFSYFPNGAVSTIVSGASNATFAYDAFGALQQLTVNTPSADVRADKYFGAFLKQRKEGSSSVLTRQIPAPGVVATRHGPTGGWTFAFGDGRGTRFVTDQSGNFVQSIYYQPFGEVKNPATPGTTNYTSEQWNGGDLLAAFGIVNLGARVYDPVIGRFLSPDPIIGKNRYAFAANDPINRADPTGLDPDVDLSITKYLDGTSGTSDGISQPEPCLDCGNNGDPGSPLGTGVSSISGDTIRNDAGSYNIGASILTAGGMGTIVDKYGSIRFQDGTIGYSEAASLAARESGADFGMYVTKQEQENMKLMEQRSLLEPDGNDGLGPLRYIPGPIGWGVRIAEGAGDLGDGRRSAAEVALSLVPAPAPKNLVSARGLLALGGLDEYSANGLRGDGRYFFASSGTISWENSYGTNNFGIDGGLSPDGTLRFNVERGPGTPNGRTMIGHLVDAFGVNNIEAIEGKWSRFPPMNTNYRIYQAARAVGAHPIYAAQLTKTGQAAWDLGFRKVTITKETSIMVRVLFRRR